jgi:hypothetical protein
MLDCKLLFVWPKSGPSALKRDQHRDTNMLIRNAFANLGVATFLVSITWGIGEASAQDAAAGGGMGGGWQAERAQIQKKVNERVEKVIAEKLTKRMVATKLHFPWPVPAPKERKDQIVKRIEKEIDKEAAAKFPEAKRKEFQKEAEKKFRVYQPGDMVPEFQLDRTYGTNVVVRQGRLYQVTENRIRVGNRWLIPDDLTEEMKARFYEEASEREIKKYVRRKNNEYNAEISKFKEGLLKKRLPLALMAGGYYPAGMRFRDSTDAGKWMPKKEVVELIYKMRHKQLVAQVSPKITRETFEAHGYELVKENGNQWMPKTEAAAFRARKAAEEAAQKAMAGPDVDIFGAPAGNSGGGMQGEPGMNPGSAQPKAQEEDLFDN